MHANDPHPNTADFLGNLKRHHALIPPGRYQVTMVPHHLGAYATARTAGIHFTLGIVGGDHDGHEIRLQLLTEGTPAMGRLVGRDVRILVAWAEGLGVPPVKSCGELVKELGRRGARRVIYMTFTHQADAGGATSMVITRVEVVPEEPAAPADGDGKDDGRGFFS